MNLLSPRLVCLIECDVQIRLHAALLCKRNINLLVDMRKDYLGQQITLLQQQPSYLLLSRQKISEHF